MAIHITSPDELALLLGKAYTIEAEFERMVEWKMYMTFPEHLRDFLFQFAHDSEKHKQALTKLYEQFLNIDIAKHVIKVDDELLSISGLTEKQIVSKVLHYDSLALDLYTKLNEYTGETLLDEVFAFGKKEEFFETMSWLIKEEKRHVALLKEFLENIKNE